MRLRNRALCLIELLLLVGAEMVEAVRKVDRHYHAPVAHQEERAAEALFLPIGSRSLSIAIAKARTSRPSRPLVVHSAVWAHLARTPAFTPGAALLARACSWSGASVRSSLAKRFVVSTKRADEQDARNITRRRSRCSARGSCYDSAGHCPSRSRSRNWCRLARSTRAFIEVDDEAANVKQDGPPRWRADPCPAHARQEVPPSGGGSAGQRESRRSVSSTCDPR
jgi:hypothetical protein